MEHQLQQHINDQKLVGPLLRPSWKRFVLYPIQHEKAWELYKKALACFWTPEETDLQKDMKQWVLLSQCERNLIGSVLAFFAASDGIVMENLAENFLTEFQCPEVRAFYAFQILMENVHSETYSLLINTYYQDSIERNKMFEAIISHQGVKNKAQWADRYIRDKSRTISERVIAFAVVEMVFFCGSFAVLFWLKSRGLLPGLSFSNELIARDESQHVEFACWVYLELIEKITEEEVCSIVKSAVDVEKNFWDQAFDTRLCGMNASLMKQYIEYVADHLLHMIGMEPIFRVSNPFAFMENISLEGKTNFFEKRVSEYRRAHVTSMSQFANDIFTFSADAEF